MTSTIFDDRSCELGEGPLWHPERQQLFWFDIVNRKLLARSGDRQQSWSFSDMVSAAGWIDRDHLLIVGERALLRFNIETGEHETIAELALGEGLRTNDGRADPWGGMWFSSMSKKAEAGAGAIFRFYKGQITELYSEITIPNAICFSPDRRFAYFADTEPSVIKRVALDAETGMPDGEPEIFLDLAADGLNPDGAVTDAEGNLWNAQWGASRVAVYDPQGTLIKTIAIGAPHSSCPAFGGEDMTAMFCTTAREGLSAQDLSDAPESGMVFAAKEAGRGLPEPRVIL